MGTKDVIKALTLGAISEIPGAGGPLANLIELYIPASLKSKRELIIEMLACTIESFGNSISVDWNNEFQKEENQNFFLKFFKLAETEHQKEKVQYFQNIFVNSILNPIEYDKKCIFLKLTSDLTLRHLTVLKLMSSPPTYLKQKQIQLGITMGGIDHLFLRALDDYEANKEFYQIVYKDLQANHLLSAGGWGVTMSVDGVLTARTTDFGREYISYLETPSSQNA